MLAENSHNYLLVDVCVYKLVIFTIHRPATFLCLIIRLQFIGSLLSIHFANVSTCDDWHISILHIHICIADCNAMGILYLGLMLFFEYQT